VTALTPTGGWKRYWGLSRTPFSKRLAASELFDHPGHQEAVARIRWAIDEHAIALVTGEVGAGKTVAVRAAIERLDASAYTVIYVANAGVGARGIHQHIAHHLGVAPRFHRGALIAQTADLLLRERDERHKHTVLICDEAHLLEADQLEQLRMLTNLEFDSDSPLALLLVGQPTLRRTLRRGSFAALDQRIAVRAQIHPLERDHAIGYLAHHLSLAGRSDPVFADDAADTIVHAARGLPRQIGNLAVAALIAGYTRNNRIVDHDCAVAAVADHTTD
jgi:type II secretory pathway predicted ATPase ExeA